MIVPMLGREYEKDNGSIKEIASRRNNYVLLFRH